MIYVAQTGDVFVKRIVGMASWWLCESPYSVAPAVSSGLIRQRPDTLSPHLTPRR
jgi:hypothetical protein